MASPTSSSVDSARPSTSQDSAAVTTGIRKNRVPTRLAAPRRNITFSSRNTTTEFTTAIQASTAPKAGQSPTRGCSNSRVAAPSTGALTRNCTAVPASMSNSPRNRFW
jgi:hypothetical protein